MSIYRAEVVGSLLRPQWLKDARDDLTAGRISVADFKKIEDRAVDEAIALQEGAGIEAITDGEQRRTIFMGTLTDCIEGVEMVSETIETQKHWGSESDRNQHVTTKLTVTGKLRRKRSLSAEEFTYLRARTSHPVKMTIPSPLMMALHYSPKHSSGAYPDPFKLFSDAADIVREDIQELAALGCTYIQIDAPELATLVDPDVRTRVYESMGISTERMLTEGIELINDVVAGIPGVLFGIHVCRGNNAGRHMASGGYEHISKQVFRGARNYHNFSLEYDDDRSGGFAPLADMPDDKTVILGLISTKRTDPESADELAQRVAEAAKYFPREQMAISPQCGFASVMAGNPITEAQQLAKLKLVSEMAQRLWP